MTSGTAFLLGLLLGLLLGPAIFPLVLAAPWWVSVAAIVVGLLLLFFGPGERNAH